MKRPLALFESIAIFALILVIMWVVMPSGILWLQITATAAAAAAVIASQRARGENWRTMGLDGTWFGATIWRFGLPALPALCGMWFFGLFAGSIKVSAAAFLLTALLYTFWALVQQYLFQAYFARRLQIVFTGRVALALVVAAMFAAVHLPAPLLTAGTFVFGFFVTLIFCKRPNLYAPAIAHGILGAAFYGFLPESLTGAISGGRGLLQIPFDILNFISRI
jgi:membrane protease YdiL (CAAX protease family)